MNLAKKILVKIKKNWQLKLLALGLAIVVWFYSTYR
jgi:hypothetical protein